MFSKFISRNPVPTGKVFSSLAAVLLLGACAGGAGTTQTPDGTKIDLSGSPLGLVTADTVNGVLTGYNQPSSFYGVWEDKTSDKYELRYQGTEAYDVPKSGKATYHGHAIRMDSISGEPLTDGTSRLNIDFGNRTVDGHITMPGLRRNITLHEGNLNNNGYSGQASVLGNSSGRYEGQLFGKGAKETAGTVEFKNNSDLNTVFGGVRY